MHGRTRTLTVLITTLACMLPAAATAAPMPAGVYDTQIGTGTMNLGTLPALSLPQPPSFPLTIGSSAVSVQLPGFDLPSEPFSQSGATGTYTVSVTGLGISLDPTTGAATVDAGIYVTISVTSPVSGTCTIASKDAPVNLHLTTSSGSPWDAATDALTLVDKTFTVPAPGCDNPFLSSFASLWGLLVGDTTVPGANTVTLPVSMVPRPAAESSPAPQSPTAQTPTGQTPTTTSPTSGASAPGCTVPRVKGKRFATKKSLRKLNAQIKKAGCKLGKVKGVKSKKRKGSVLKQSRKPGAKLPLGTRINLTVARGA